MLLIVCMYHRTVSAVHVGEYVPNSCCRESMLLTVVTYADRGLRFACCLYAGIFMCLYVWLHDKTLTSHLINQRLIGHLLGTQRSMSLDYQVQKSAS